jgi:hypothetical protein
MKNYHTMKSMSLMIRNSARVVSKRRVLKGGDALWQNIILHSKQYAPSINTRIDKLYSAKELKKVPSYT